MYICSYILNANINKVVWFVKNYFSVNKKNREKNVWRSFLVSLVL